MFKSRGLNITFLIMGVVIFAGLVLFIVMNVIKPGDATTAKAENIDNIVKNLTVDTEEITTNLKDDHFIKVQFKLQASDKDTKDELTKREFQVKNAIIYTLSNLTPKDLQGSDGLNKLESLLKAKINSYLKKGHLTHVYTTEKIIQ